MTKVTAREGQQAYTARPTTVLAEQYHAGGPLPVGAVDAMEPIFPAAGGPYVSTSTGVYPVRDTEWVLSDARSGLPIEVVDDETFTERFVSIGETLPAQG